MGLVDAHAGALGALGAAATDAPSLDQHLTMVGGTSSCVMALSAEPRPIHGVWGPFRDAVLPDTWLNEAGQSATGALLEHLIAQHTGGDVSSEKHAAVLLRIAELRQAEGEAFGAGIHVLPDFHGNRAPLGEPQARGVISGLTLDTGFDALCRLYYRTAVLSPGTHILETLDALQ